MATWQNACVFLGIPFEKLCEANANADHTTLIKNSAVRQRMGKDATIEEYAAAVASAINDGLDTQQRQFTKTMAHLVLVGLPDGGMEGGQIAALAMVAEDAEVDDPELDAALQYDGDLGDEEAFNDEVALGDQGIIQMPADMDEKDETDLLSMIHPDSPVPGVWA